MTRHLAPTLRCLLAGALCAALLLTSGCSGDGEPEAGPSPSPSPEVSLGDQATLKPRPVPMEVRVTWVAGKLSKKRRSSLERGIGGAVAAYFHSAWLGDYPRRNFRDAFPRFTREAARLARADRGVTTNVRLGRSTEAVHVKKRLAVLNVLAPGRYIAGVTARIHLVFVADRGARRSQRVVVRGRLLFTGTKEGWRVFGYDIARSVHAAGRGGKR